jgi:Ca2+/Na+ antiporter
MQAEKLIYEWSATNKQMKDRGFIIDSEDNILPMGTVFWFLLMLIPIYNLVISRSILSALEIFIPIALIYFLAFLSYKTSKRYNDEVEENYRIFDYGIEISHNGRAMQCLKWNEISKVELHSNMPEYKLYKLFDRSYALDAIMIWKNSHHDHTALVIGNNSKKQEILSYIKNKISLNPLLEKKEYKSFRMTVD